MNFSNATLKRVWSNFVGETRLTDVKFEDLQALYAINAAGPLVMARHFVPLLQKGSGAFGAPNPGLYSPKKTMGSNIFIIFFFNWIISKKLLKVYWLLRSKFKCDFK